MTLSTRLNYIYGDDLISQKRSSLTSYYHYDGQMSTRQLTDSSQEITDGYTYDAFGILLNKFGATVNDYLYTGEQYDPNVGFYYLRARYYNASIGRFLTMDEWSCCPFSPYSLHKYLYCEGDPINYHDPSGEFRLTLIHVTIALSIVGILAGAVVPHYTITKSYDSNEDLFENWKNCMINSGALTALTFAGISLPAASLPFRQMFKAIGTGKWTTVLSILQLLVKKNIGARAFARKFNPFANLIFWPSVSYLASLSISCYIHVRIEMKGDAK